jgi:alpha-L-fucosidase 2
MPTFNPVEQAALHPILCDKPAPEFFEGAVLGNGGMGVIVTTRPDAVVLHFGHNNVWDIRVAENNADKIGAFQEIFDRVKAISPDLASLDNDPWYNQYREMTEENYRAPYPRPFPCGSFILGFDRRKAELIGHKLDISIGLCEIQFKIGDTFSYLQIFVDMSADRVWLRMVGENGKPAPSIFERVRLLPDPQTPDDIPIFTLPVTNPDTLSFEQRLPFQEPHVYDAAHPKDRAFRLSARLNADLGDWSPADGSRSDPNINELAGVGVGKTEKLKLLEKRLLNAHDFIACVQLDEGLASAVTVKPLDIPSAEPANFESAAQTSRQTWQSYWMASGVKLQDQFLERVWYWNLYFFNCAVKAGATCPGLFANWSYRNIGTAWHGDYHMNYNTQQPFWLAFSSNHVDKHLPYVDLVDHLLPISRKWAKEYYGLRGAYFPHSAYPVEMNIMPYPSPTWGWEICETPWTVQSLWWHYLYTMDAGFLRQRAFVPIKEAVLFLVDYMTRPDAHGQQWGDDKYHIFPTVSPELYGLMPGFKRNFDCLVDLTLTKFVFNAYLQASEILSLQKDEAELTAAVSDILNHFPDYPTAESSRGKVFVSVPDENPEVVYNTPNSGMTVFPGEDHGLHSSPEIYEVAANSYRNQHNEGGNELVFLNLQGARLGMLDLERFKRQIHYCMLPNGTCTDKVLQVHGRYTDTLPYEYMAQMGIWLENLALPVVVNECLLQSYNGTLRFFPNWSLEQAAEFRTLRAAGGFLVSAACANGSVEWIEIFSEAGAPLRIILPWNAKVTRHTGEIVLTDSLLETETEQGETIRLTPA